ncbi:DNA methyltransferase [Thiospirochaeta perfilievii]|uniref:site-specific DNA-methyltransferase (adenine-specific) n=1 Tax=Thiospirochaeta perfilievii TaxID=252967 RepID=A0A5C1QAQ1_9SPIO|nr:DNA adenine methylase [Thiospirochaeta perfilievii]QEN04130.1 DNA methyltransferase [Thiospirochaeta perfilievii]
MIDTPYLTKQLIAYIGNKRSLLPFLSNVFDSLPLKENTIFQDPFSGSGAVSRLGKSKGFEVHSNDWEYYSYIVNSCYIGINKEETGNLFKEYGGLNKVFKMFESLDNSFTPYISKHYAPKDTNSADYVTERLFYTRENAIFIDRARSLIEEMYPGSLLSQRKLKEKNILLSSLLYEVSTHANTSGVFKACHKGFGGHGKDALGRILAPMKMEIPRLIDNYKSHTVSKMDALDFVKGKTTDICYLDPPYNMHQYGSNYFMLNTVALWDKPEVNGARGLDGRYLEKAGIRKDWKSTKSPYCYKKQAPDSFRDLMENIDSRHIILSYNTEGIIPFNELFDIMERQGKVNLHIKDYTLYRGGKQSLSRKNHNMELLLVVDREGKPDGKDRASVERFLKERRVLNQLRMPFNPDKISKNFFINGSKVQLSNNLDELRMFKEYKFMDQPDNLNCLSSVELGILYKKLDKSLCKDNFEETKVLISILEKESDKKNITKIQKRILVVYKKLAFKKYIDIFYEVTRILNKKIKDENKNFLGMEDKIQEIESIAKLRFEG